jgi:outer membrane protein
MQKKLWISMVFCIVMILGTSFSSQAKDDKVGYINLQRLVNESERGKAAKNDIKKLRDEREAELKTKLKELNDLKTQIDKEGDKMDPSDKRDKVQTLNRAYKDYQRMVADAREDITNEDKELVSIILKEADGVLKKVAKKKGYAIIIKDPNAVGYLDPSVDITDDVLKELNK